MRLAPATASACCRACRRHARGGRAHPVRGRARLALRPARRSCLRPSMSCARRSAAGFTIPRARPAARSSARPACICASRPARTRCVLNQRSAAATPWPFLAPGMSAQMQSNMAATLNIDWLLDLAREILARVRASRAAARDLLAGLDDRILARPPCRLIFHPYISRAGERGPFMDCHGAGAVHRPRIRHGLCGHDARRLRRALPCGARLLFGDGADPGRGAPRRRRGALQGADADAGRRARHAGPPGGTRGSRSRRRGDHGRGAAGRLSRHRRRDRRMGRSAARRTDRAGRADRRRLRAQFPDLSRNPESHAADLARLAIIAEEPGMPRKIAIIGDLFMQSDIFEEAIRAGLPRCRSGYQQPRSALARRADGAWLCRRPGWTG